MQWTALGSPETRPKPVFTGFLTDPDVSLTNKSVLSVHVDIITNLQILSFS